MDVVTLKESFRPSTVAKGVSHWLNVSRWHNVEDCAHALKAAGYKIYGALPRPDCCRLGELPVDHKAAVVFGNEHKGLHPDWEPHLDQSFTIPMAGMVESLNISVAAAVTLHDMTRRMKTQPGYLLEGPELDDLMDRWACESVNGWEKILSQ